MGRGRSRRRPGRRHLARLTLLRIPEPFDYALSTSRFQAFGTDLANRFVDGVLHRAIGGRDVSIAPASGGVDVEPLDNETRSVVMTLLGTPFDLNAFYAWAEGPMHGLTERLHGFRPPLQPNPFEALVSSITAQQVSLFSAVAIRNRLIERFGERIGDAWAFPTRARIAQAHEDELFAVGFTHRKAEYAVALARSDIDLDSLALLSDDEVRATITALRGIGPWTAEWFLARHLARPHAWPAGDLVLRKAALNLYRVDVHELAAQLHPFENLSAQYLLMGSLVP
ncbi:MAG: DNA-3-methyladenine glycosylase family protein [Gaiellaceae bacterium]